MSNPGQLSCLPFEMVHKYRQFAVETVVNSIRLSGYLEMHNPERGLLQKLTIHLLVFAKKREGGG